jgi:redox-sensitive bicupin YhaK (pirin superfamily)
VAIHQDAAVHTARFDSDAEIAHEFAAGRHGWLQVARGAVTLNDAELRAGDGAAISDESRVVLRGSAGAELLLFDLA